MPKPPRRSGCPVSIALEILGDRWSLLIVRDLMVRGYRTFKEFQTSSERIATNILSDRLRKLEAARIVQTETDARDGRKTIYRLTERGIDLAPPLLELMVWGATHEKTSAPPELVRKLKTHREAFLAEVRRRWAVRDDTPLIPPFKRR